MIHYLRALAARLRGLFGDRRADREFDDEIETHLRLLTERYVRQGMTEAEAAPGRPPPVRKRHIAARRHIARCVESDSSRRSFRILRYGVRMLRRNPRLHLRRRAHAGAGHRREHGDLQRDRSGDAAPAAVSEFRTPLRAVEERAGEEY